MQRETQTRPNGDSAKADSTFGTDAQEGSSRDLASRSHTLSERQSERRYNVTESRDRSFFTTSWKLNVDPLVCQGEPRNATPP